MADEVNISLIWSDNQTISIYSWILLIKHLPLPTLCKAIQYFWVCYKIFEVKAAKKVDHKQRGRRLRWLGDWRQLWIATTAKQGNKRIYYNHKKSIVKVADGGSVCPLNTIRCCFGWSWFCCKKCFILVWIEPFWIDPFFCVTAQLTTDLCISSFLFW